MFETVWMKSLYIFFLCFAILCSGTAYAQFPYAESFKNATAPGTEGFGASITGGGINSAFLTAAGNAPGGVGQPGSGPAIDVSGLGYLRLTNSTNNQTGYIFNDTRFPSTNGIHVEFEYYTYGGGATGADGVTLFLFDADVPAFTIGAFGGSLGYAQKHDPLNGVNDFPGVSKGFLGIGFDEYGNFSNPTEGRQGGVVNTDPGSGGRSANSVTIRGDGDGFARTPTNYEYITNVRTDNATNGNFPIAGGIDGRNMLPEPTSSSNGYRKAIIDILPGAASGTFKINVSIQHRDNGVTSTQHVIVDRIYTPSVVPVDLKYGFASSTGASTNFHEIRSIDIVVPPTQYLPPTATNDIMPATTEDSTTPVTLNIITNTNPANRDFDPNGNTTLVPSSIDLDPSTPLVNDKTFVTVQGTFSVDNNGLVSFVPKANFNGTATATYTIKDDGNGLSAEIRTSNTATISVVVSPVNDAPSGTNKTVTMLEDASRPFTATDFGFTDPTDALTISGSGANTLGAVIVTTLPALGTLKLSGVDVTAGQSIPVASIPNLAYAPAANANGIAYSSFTFQVVDNGTGANTDLSPNTFTFDVTSVNDAPGGTDKTLTLLEDTPHPFTAADFGFTDPVDVLYASGANALTSVTITTLPSAGTLTLSGAAVTAGQVVPVVDITGGKLIFTPALHANGGSPHSTFTFQVKDDGGVLNSGVDLDPVPNTILINITAVNDAPVAVNDAATTAEDTPVTFSITANDTDVEGPVNTASIDLIPSTIGEEKTITIAGQGTYTANSNGTITFVPVLNYAGTATPVGYTIKDPEGEVSNIATITVTVTPVNDPPVAVNDVATTNEDVAITFSVTGNDADIDADGSIDITTIDLDPSTAGTQTTVTIAGQGTFVANNNGTVTFTPVAGYNSGAGNVTPISYTVKDNTGLVSNTATITVKVLAKAPPVANPDAVTTAEDTPVTFSVSANDTDFNGNITIALGSIDLDPATSGSEDKVFTVSGQGTYVANNDGTVTFTPVLNYNSGLGTATPINYTIKDNTGLVSNSTTIRVTVTAVNDPPVAVNDIATTSEDTPVTFSISANDIDVDGTIDVTSIDLDPATTGIQTTLTITGQGTYTLNNNGTVTFVPVLNYNSGSGSATPITYTIRDNTGLLSNIATISVRVSPVNDPPSVSNIPKSGSVGQTILFNSIDFKNKFTDPDGDALTRIGIVSLPLNGTLRLYSTNIVAGQEISLADLDGISFIPDANWSGVTNFVWNGFDGSVYALATANGIITINPNAANNPPVVTNVPKSGLQGQTILFKTVDFTSKFTDPENNPLIKIRISSLPLNGLLKLYGVNITAGQEIPVLDLDGITFVPDAGWSGTASFPWNGNDGSQFALSNASVVITLAPVNTAPTVAIVPKTGVADRNVTFTSTDFSSRFADAEGTALNKILVGGLPANGTLKLYGLNIVAGQEIAFADLNGITFTPNASWTGVTTFPWNGSDGTAYAAAASNVIITIAPAPNSPPVVSDISKTGTGSKPIPFGQTDFTGKFTDADGQTLVKVKIVTLPPSGTLRLNGINVVAGQEIPAGELSLLTFDPALNFSGSTSFEWNASDGLVFANNNAKVNISVVLPSDPAAKIGLAKKLVSVTPAINGTYDVKFLFTLNNFGQNILDNISLTDNLALSFAGAQVTVKTIKATGNLKANTNFNGISQTNLLLASSTLLGAEEALVELDINIKLLLTGGIFQNTALAEGASSITGLKVSDRSTNGLKSDPNGNGDISPAETTPIELLLKPAFIPNGFTPNNDGIHDFFVIEDAFTKRVALEIYNRWGNRVYKSLQYRNDWAGRCTEGIFLGQEIPDGTYFYVVVVENKDKYVGSLTVHR